MVKIIELDDGFYLFSKDESTLICKLTKKRHWGKNENTKRKY